MAVLSPQCLNSRSPLLSVTCSSPYRCSALLLSYYSQGVTVPQWPYARYLSGEVWQEAAPHASIPKTGFGHDKKLEGHSKIILLGEREDLEQK